MSFIVENAGTLMQSYLKQIMICVMDDSNLVQESACTNFSRLVENASQMILPYFKDVLLIFQMALQKYRGTPNY